MGRRGFELREAGTLSEIDRLQKRMQEQEHERLQKEFEHEEITLADARKSVRDNLISRMVSSSTGEYEKDFIRSYLMLRDEKREEYQKRFFTDQCYFTMREYDSTHHLQDMINTTPEMKEESCKRCGRYRRMKGEELCLGCLGVTNG
jgi:predicted ThiF/HesA family dinucleotide-utilizing enzyme